MRACADRPLISIVVPSYNQGRFIADNINALRDSRRLGVEVLVMDGGSDDETVETLMRLSEHIDHWVSAPDGGQAEAINDGLRKARGDWVAFQNSDDFYEPDALEAVIAHIELNPDVDLIIGGMRFVGEFGEHIRTVVPKPVPLIALAERNYINNQALFVRSDLLARAGLLDDSLKFCLDFEWFVRLLRHSRRRLYITAPLGCQRIHGESKTTNFQDIHDREFSAVVARTFTRVEVASAYALRPLYKLLRLSLHALIKVMRVRTIKSPLLFVGRQ